jgi:hypothetical protein
VNKPTQTIEIVVSGDLTFPSMSVAGLSGQAVTLVLEGVTVAGYSAQMGGSQGPRPSQRAQDHVRIQLSASSAVLAPAPEPEPAPVDAPVEDDVVASAPELEPEPEPTI